MKIRVTADSTCDLSPELRASYGITLVPLTVMLGEDAFHDGVNVTPQDIIHAVENGKTCKTAAVNVYEYEELFRRVKEDCDAVIHLCIGKKFSVCYDNACQAAKQCGNVYVVDSGNLSVGLGMMALDAVEMARANAVRNGLDAVMTCTAVNVFDLLPQLERESSPYDLIILDPPAFTKSRKTVDNAMAGYREINYRAMRLLPRGGLLATCSCSHFATEERFTAMLREAARDAGVQLRQIEARQQSCDHPILWGVPETSYLKFYLFQVV